MSQQKVCQPLVCAISHRGSSLSCWNTVKKTIFPGKLPGPGLSTPAERAQVSCSRVIITNINTLFKFMSNRPVVVQNECHPYLPAREVRSICKENEIVFQVYIMSHILLHLFSHVRQNPINFWDYFLWAGLRQPWCRPSPSPGGFYDNLHSYQACSHSWPGNLKARRCWSCQFLQVLLRWGLQQGVALLPKSSKTERQKQNLEVQ